MLFFNFHWYKHLTTGLHHLVFILPLISFHWTAYAGSLTTNLVTRFDDTVATSDYVVDLTDNTIRYCIDESIRFDFNLTFTLTNGATWGTNLTSSSLWLSSNNSVLFSPDVTVTLVNGGTTSDSQAEFVIQLDDQSLSSGQCFLLGADGELAMRVPKGSKAGTLFEIQAQLITPTARDSLSTQWLELTNCSAITEIPQGECTSLLELYDNTDGDNWSNITTNPWKHSKTPCSWLGITCTEGRITKISLPAKNLVGTLPDFSALTELQVIDLQNNKLTGSLPGLENFNQLEMFLLDNNQMFFGTLPNLSTLTNLQVLSLGNNQLTGPLSVENLPTSLQILRLLQNPLTGTLPDFSAFTQLETLKLQSNQFTGTIPDFSALTNLQELWLSGNQLSGEIPATLTALTQLDDTTGLDLNYNQLTAHEPALLVFLENKNPTWDETQTLPPTVLNATALSTTAIQLEWTPIAYTADGGYYQIQYATTSGGPYTNAGTTTDKNANSYLVEGLSPNTPYYFVIETVTPPHNYSNLANTQNYQQKQLISTLSQEVSATTLGPEIEVQLEDGTSIADGVGSVDFGSTPLGTDVTKTITIFNRGETTLNLSSLAVNSIEFVIQQNFGTSTVAPNAFTTFTVKLNATTPGSFTDTISFANNDLDENPYEFSVTGSVIAPEIDVQLEDGTSVADGSNQITFGTTQVGIDRLKTFTVINTGQYTLNLTPIDFINGDGFILETNFQNTVLGPGESTNFAIKLDANQSGNFNRTISFINDDNDENPYNFSVVGSVTASEIPIVDVLNNGISVFNNSPVDFGTTPLGSDIVKTFTVVNNSQMTLNLPPMNFTNGNGFILEKNFENNTLAPSESTTFEIKLDASRVGNFSHNISFLYDETGQNRYDFSISGVVVAPEIEVANCPTQIEIPLAECEALVTLYRNTNGSDWTDSPQNNWNTTNTPCSWTGIICQNGQVTQINRANQNLVGTLPDLSALTALQDLSLDNNQLSDPLPDFNALINLRILRLNNNQFTGEIPASLNALLQLETLDLQNNQLSGIIPNLSNLTNLRELSLSDNQLTGEVPTGLNNLTQLQRLRLANNQLTGLIPDFNNLTNLMEYRLNDNQLSGPIPVELNRLTALRTLHLGNNQLSGPIPTELAQLVNLEQLHLSSNQLSGEIPPSFTQLLNLTELNLDFNQLLIQNEELTLFLEEKFPGVSNTQTIPPTQLVAIALPSNQPVATALPYAQIQLNWKPIAYTEHGGYYQIRYGTTKGGPYPSQIQTTIEGKQATGSLITDLEPNTTYYFIVETYTPANLSGSQNDLISIPSAEIEVTTHSLFFSEPSPESLLDMADSELGHPTTTATLTVLEMGIETLQISDSNISGQHANDFRIISGEAPFSIEDGSPPHPIIIQCTPSNTDELSATLTLTTNDPYQPTVTYPLKCEGIGPIYRSEPEPDSILVMRANDEFGTSTTTATITVFNHGNGPLTVNSYNLTGPHISDFTILNGPPFQVDKGEHTIRLECRPTEAGQRIAFLNLTTNAPNQPEVLYRLTCLNSPIFKGEITTEAGETGSDIEIDAPEKVTLSGQIWPPDIHLDQPANIVMTYHWTPYYNGRSLDVPTTIATQQPLQKAMEIPLFEGTLIGLAGEFRVDLGYELNDNRGFSGEIVRLTVRPNRAPLAILLDGDTIEENSPPDTLIGTLTTIDDDKGDWFSHGFLEEKDTRFKPSRYLKIVGNELRVREGFILNFENDFEYDISVLSVDATGDFVTQTFPLQITNIEYTAPKSLRLTNKYVLENSLANTAVGRFITKNQERGTYLYELLDEPQTVFRIDNNLLRVADSNQLDFEKQSTYPITVSSTQIETGEQIVETFTLVVVNLEDIATLVDIRDTTTGAAIAQPLNPANDVSITLLLIPDAIHRGQQADIVSIAMYRQSDTIVGEFVRDSTGWQEWEQRLVPLPAIEEEITLQNTHEVLLWQGPLTTFAGGQVDMYLGYRLENGALFYNPEPVTLMIDAY
jgi:Leucine-rich repeat (LRR) protein